MKALSLSSLLLLLIASIVSLNCTPTDAEIRETVRSEIQRLIFHQGHKASGANRGHRENRVPRAMMEPTAHRVKWGHRVNLAHRAYKGLLALRALLAQKGQQARRASGETGGLLGQEVNRAHRGLLAHKARRDHRVKWDHKVHRVNLV